MKAVVYERFGSPDVLHLQEVTKPVPKDDEVLVRIHATTVTSADVRIRAKRMPAGFGVIAPLMFGFRKPRNPILGVEFAGVIEQVGREVTTFKLGDAVFGIHGAGMRCYAEYKTIKASGPIALKPDAIPFEEAAAIPFGGGTALHFLRQGKLTAGEKVLIIGASGSVGNAAVQLARSMGAEVTGVCSTANVELVKSLGADHVVDYTIEDFRRSVLKYDVVMETIGLYGFTDCKSVLKENGRFIPIAGGLPDFAKMAWTNLTDSRKTITRVVTENAEDLRTIAGLAVAGTYKVVIDRTWPLEEMSEAHRYVDTGHKRGNVVIRVMEV